PTTELAPLSLHDALPIWGGKLPVAGVGDTAAVRVQLNLVVNTNIGLAYRKGPVATGVALSQLRARLVGDSVEVWSRVERRGTARSEEHTSELQSRVDLVC